MESFSTIILAFFEGFALIISPCILPILPIILSGSLANRSKSKPFGIVLGFILSFTFFTYFSRKLVQISGIDLDIIRYVSLGLLVVFAVIMLSDALTARFEWLTQRFSNLGIAQQDYSRFEFMNGVAFGCLVGVIWTPCAGPILAAVILQTVLQQSDWMGLLVVLAFGVGAGLPMLLIALLGTQIMAKLTFFKRHGHKLRKGLGLIILLTVAYIVFGNPLPERFNSLQNINQNRLVDPLYKPYPAPALTGIEHWINSKPLELNQLRGDVVLIDFWAYSCINCVRTLPYLKDWYEKYHSKGFTIIGVQTPEFDFESKLSNVEAAVKKYGILYPVALDNQWLTWRNYNNHYWPAHYLIDTKGNIVYTHFGEGDYAVTENNIRFLLGINKPMEKDVASTTIGYAQTPETYLGFERLTSYASPEIIVPNGTQSYTFPSEIPIDAWALQGKWTVQEQYITSAEARTSIKLHFRGKQVYAVMGSRSGKPIKVDVYLNGSKITNHPNQDTQQGTLLINEHDLYRILTLDKAGEGILELIAEDPGLEIYTFTFGA